MKTMVTKGQIKGDMKFSINWRIIRILRMFTNIKYLELI